MSGKTSQLVMAGLGALLLADTSAWQLLTDREVELPSELPGVPSILAMASDSYGR